MLDINLIRETPGNRARDALRKRQMDPGVVDAMLELDEERRALLAEVETLKAERNNVSKEIGQMKDAAERQARIESMRELGDKISALDGAGARWRRSCRRLPRSSPTSRMKKRPSAKMNTKMWW